MDAKEEPTFDELCRIVGDIAARYGIRRVRLFGSRARGDHRADSDYDLCILPGERCSVFVLGGFITDLQEALGRDVDLVYEDCMRDDIAEAVRAEGRLLYDS